MVLSYLIADAGGNTTVFVRTPVARSARAAAAKTLMERLGAEQAAFLTEGRMEMMGGEFCGNASRSFAVWQALHREDAPGLRLFSGVQEVTVSVSGAPAPVSVTIEGENAPDRCRARIRMPLPVRILPLQDAVLGGCTLVEYPGISHFVLQDRVPQEGDLARGLALLRENKAQDGCCGLLYRTGADEMRPLVYVRETDTLVWESSCASGTCAVSAAEAWKRKASVSLDLRQPGGTLHTDAVFAAGALTELALGGEVRFYGWGEASL